MAILVAEEHTSEVVAAEASATTTWSALAALLVAWQAAVARRDVTLWRREPIFFGKKLFARERFRASDERTSRERERRTTRS